jgi:hypothetical protein
MVPVHELSNPILTERMELFSLDFVESVLRAEFVDYVNSLRQVRFEDLLLVLSRQATGRATRYRHTIEDVVRSYSNGRLSDEEDRELRCRIAACPLFNVALERFVSHSLISWLVSNNIAYRDCHMSTSADFAILIDQEEIPNIIEGMGQDNPPATTEYQSILLSVDAKSLMGLSNLGDALTHGNVLGKLEANWNQISYTPPLLREAMASNDAYFNRKHGTIEPTINFGETEYLFVSVFVCDLVSLPNRAFFTDPLMNLNGSYFNHHWTIVAIPNRSLQSSFYDSFFTAGKGGYSDDRVTGFPPYPVDCRFQVIGSNEDTAVFRNLPNIDFRFRYLNQHGTYNAITKSSRAELEEQEFSIR